MVFSLTWLPRVLKAAGLKVALVDGWESRGHGDVGDVVGVMCHHTVGAREGNMPTLKMLVGGRPDLRGPLSQLGLGRDGTYYVIAAGRCYHAGSGSWRGVTTGNASFIGIEGENAGGQNDDWPPIQMDAYRHGVAAILKHIGRGVEFCCAHKEYAPTRKPDDPRFEMDAFRADVARILAGAVARSTLIPGVEPTAAPGLLAPRDAAR